jgi:hypothetical protein
MLLMLYPPRLFSPFCLLAFLRGYFVSSSASDGEAAGEQEREE